VLVDFLAVDHVESRDHRAILCDREIKVGSDV
jgi:hypothetical protein